MKYVTAFLLFLLCLIGVVGVGSLWRDVPEYAPGEPIAIAREWSSNHPGTTSSNVSAAGGTIVSGTDSAKETRPEIVWTEEYLGHGKWRVSKAILSSGYSRENLTFEEWIAGTKGWDETRLAEYSSDLSPEDEEAFQAQLRSYNSNDRQFASVLEQLYLYEKSGLVERVRD